MTRQGRQSLRGGVKIVGLSKQACKQSAALAWDEASAIIASSETYEEFGDFELALQVAINWSYSWD